MALAKLEAMLNKTNANLMLINPPAVSSFFFFLSPQPWSEITHTQTHADALTVLQFRGGKKREKSPELQPLILEDMNSLRL